ncbi:MAG: hypothetical protein WB992_08695 [Bryobacteraceae bacterium]
MSVSVNIPEELYEQARAIAEAHRVPVDEVFASAFIEHLAALEKLRQRAARGDRNKFLAVLDKVPDVNAEEFDRV